MGQRRRLKMMWDYAAFPLWTIADETGPWSFDEVTLSDQLRRDLKAWSDEWTGAMWGEQGPDAPGWEAPPDETFRQWDRSGRALVVRVRDEVGPTLEVGYFNEVTGEVEWPSERP